MSRHIISEEDVKKIADLSRLQLDDDEVKTATKNLEGILEHFSQIQRISTDNVPTADDVSGLKNIMRDDIARENLLCTPEDLLNNAPAVQDNQIKVSAVFDQE